MRYFNYILKFMAAFLFCVSPCFAGPNASGDYIMSSFGDDVNQLGTPNQSADEPWASLVDINLDGQGNGTSQDLYVSSGDLESGAFTYSIKADGMFELVPSAGVVFYGIIDPDDNIFSIAETAAEDLAIHFAIKKSFSMANTSINGKYIICQFSNEISQLGTPAQSADKPMAALTEIIVDGQGNGTFQDLYISSGDLESGVFTYSVVNDGSLTVNIGGNVAQGIVSSDGSIFTIASTLSNEPGIIVGIKKSSDMSNTSVKGKYIVCQFSDEISQLGTPDQSADNPWAGLVEFTLDGQGKGTFQELYASDNELDSGTFTYTVDDDGSLTLNIDGDVVHGIVSSDGSIFTTAITSSSEPGIQVGIKKSPIFNPSLPLLMLEN